MSKIINFRKKENPRFSVMIPENDFQFALRELTISSIEKGRVQGFIIGTFFAIITTPLFHYILSHYL